MSERSEQRKEEADKNAITKEMRNYLVNAKFAIQDSFPATCTYSTETEVIPHSLIVGGTVLFVNAVGLAAGSAGDLDLYKLLTAYLHDPVARKAMNRISLDSELTLIKAKKQNRVQ